jgi:pyrimidine deaminase RibD-like protein
MPLTDKEFMKIAIDEAQKCESEDKRPHPMVGAVVVKDGKVLAAGYRGEFSPGDHAEFTVLEKKLEDEILAGATVYTTLEPCTTRNHPKVPCAERLIERKIAKVVIGMLDPDPRITGKGQRRLREANIWTSFFDPDLMSIIEEINRSFTREKTKAFKAEEASVKMKRERDIKTITRLLSNIHTETMDYFLDRGKDLRIINPIFHHWEGFRAYYASSGFHVYDEELRKRIEAFCRSWSVSLSFGEWFTDTPGFREYRFMERHETNKDGWEESREEALKAIYETESTFLELLNYIRKEFEEIDIGLLSENAKRDYIEFNKMMGRDLS